ncbi:FecR domain-containing protein [Prolixibacteraceae bacterium Z1-6]|uniref:FecR domain-containing protein n=1 Tax=Draconibacterium aestuarii TaxID=2998507 RepID=A0A9X3J4Y7_9BACT|nr:FecR domain-containing protein [Prolixibacteraceae bacterium Z1-6]
MKNSITKYLDGTASKAEQAKMLLWLRQKENRLVFNSLKLEWKNGLDKEQLPADSEKTWSTIQDQLLQKSYTGWQSSRKMNQFFRIAAIFFFILSVGSAVYFVPNQFRNTAEFYTNVIADNGHISKVELPDGSTVWLNSGSEISYNNFFAANNRNIKLTGEAYFSVTKNKDIPLVVNAGELEVKVLGTKFNVAAYPESKNISVVLESGKVELLSSKSETFQYQLKPGEKASFNKDSRELDVSQVNTSKFTSWKDGMINIYDQTLEELVKRLETRYNQKFKFDEAIKNYHFTFTIKNESLDQTIGLMEKIAPIKAEQNGEIIEFKLEKKRKRAVDE